LTILAAKWEDGWTTKKRMTMLMSRLQTETDESHNFNFTDRISHWKFRRFVILRYIEEPVVATARMITVERTSNTCYHNNETNADNE